MYHTVLSPQAGYLRMSVSQPTALPGIGGRQQAYAGDGSTNDALAFCLGLHRGLSGTTCNVNLIWFTKRDECVSLARTFAALWAQPAMLQQAL
jgi:hypothetical protein